MTGHKKHLVLEGQALPMCGRKGVERTTDLQVHTTCRACFRASILYYREKHLKETMNDGTR